MTGSLQFVWQRMGARRGRHEDGGEEGEIRAPAGGTEGHEEGAEDRRGQEAPTHNETGSSSKWDKAAGEDKQKDKIELGQEQGQWSQHN